MENAKVTIGKNKKMKIVLCYIGLVVLVALLLLPPIFRLAFQEKEEIKEQVVTTLDCVKNGESVKGTFLNEKPQMIIYKIYGDYRIKETPDEYELDNSNPDETSSTETTTLDESNDSKETETYNDLFEKLSDFADITYNEENNLTELRVDINRFIGSKDYELIFSSVNGQESYYKNQGFTCNKISNTYKVN